LRNGGQPTSKRAPTRWARATVSASHFVIGQHQNRQYHRGTAPRRNHLHAISVRIARRRPGTWIQIRSQNRSQMQTTQPGHHCCQRCQHCHRRTARRRCRRLLASIVRRSCRQCLKLQRERSHLACQLYHRRTAPRRIRLCLASTGRHPHHQSYQPPFRSSIERLRNLRPRWWAIRTWSSDRKRMTSNKPPSRSYTETHRRLHKRTTCRLI